MSERSAALGGSPKTITYKGKTYNIAGIVTEDTMLAVEARMYDREKLALFELKSAYTSEAFHERVDSLLKRKVAGEFSFESESTLEFMQTTEGAVMLLGCMMSADKAEILDLLTAKPAEMELILNEVLADSFPDGVPSPKPSARTPNRASKKRRKGR